MDSTTLISFMVQTHPSVQSVHLLGSWDNFQKSYSMERDTRKGRGQWHGCYSFKDIICDGDESSKTKRSGGLKMGHEYWYYYELDDGTETYNRSLPSTTHCPYMPGQTLNTLWVPVEVNAPRTRSASTSSIASAFMTMNPADKYITPRAPPPTPSLPRLNTSPAILDPPFSTKSQSPKTPKLPSPWSPRNLFGLKTPMSASERKEKLNIRIPSRSEFGDANISSPTLLSRTEISLKLPYTPNTSTMPGTMSSQSSCDRPSVPAALISRLRTRKSENAITSLTIPDEIAEEEEDDENFATVEIAEIATMLSPPPTAIRRIDFPPLRSSRSTLSESSDEDRISHQLPIYRRLGKSLSSPSIRTPPSRSPPPPPTGRVPARAGTVVHATRPHLVRSHFSMDSIDCAIDSDTETGTSDTAPQDPTMYTSDEGYTSSDFDDIKVDADHEHESEEQDSPLIPSDLDADHDHDQDTEHTPTTTAFNRFSYALPDHLASDLPLRKLSSYSTDSRRETFGLGIEVGLGEVGVHDGRVEGESVLGDFLGEMGYLGEAIHQG